MQGWRERQVLERLNAAPTSTWRLVEMEIKVKGSKFFGFDFGYYTKVMGNELYIEIGAGSLQPDNSWRLQVNGQSLLLAVARDDGEAVVPLCGGLIVFAPHQFALNISQTLATSTMQPIVPTPTMTLPFSKKR